MSWYTGYELTIYCKACNYPKNSRNIAYSRKKGDDEDIPEEATAGLTVAVHPDHYNEYKGKRSHLDILDENGMVLSSHQPFILDNHRNGKKIIDFYMGERDICECSKHPWSGKKCRFKFLQKVE